jgi:hypothetical protein
MAEIPPPFAGESVPTYHDRKAGLVIFGIVEIAAGALAGVLIGLMLLGQFMMAQMTHQPPQLRMIMPSA